jgi:NAD(P)-dependent dehydrogenase (short-subunit alcohol dehydrogenase family)
VLVTGCSTGFGLQTALYLAARNFNVYATMRDLSRRTRLEAEAGRRNLTLRVLPLDVTDPASIDRVVATMVDEAGGIYGVVNNAGLFLRGFFEDLQDSEIRQVFETNLFGTMAVVRAALPPMIRAGQGRIVLVTSIAGRIGAPTGAAYSASRFAQEGFIESLSQEIGPLGLQSVLIEPGITRTEQWTFDRGAAARARDPHGPYYRWFKRAEILFNQAMQSSPITSHDVARTIYRALTARRPRLRYVVGRRARLVLGLRQYLPGELFERVYFGEIIRRLTGGSDQERKKS